MDQTGLPKRWSKVTCTAFDVIEAIDDLEGATVTELADHLDLAASTVHNHIGALQRREYVIKEGDVYRLGLKFLTLGISVRDSHELAHISQPIVEDMASETGESAWAKEMEYDRLVVIAGANGENSVKTYGTIGFRRLPHANASGKAILAHLPETQVHQILDRTGLPAYTENTITSREKLFEDFESVRERGYAVNRGEYLDGGYAVACAVLNEAEPIGALGISGPARRFQDEQVMDELINVLLESKNIVELKLSSP